jgi:hypothetical protein
MLFAVSCALQVRESQESIVLLDRTHTLKVQQVQKEYQEFMERIRNKAQVRANAAKQAVDCWQPEAACNIAQFRR